MDTSFLFQNCYTGTDFENLMVQFLGEHGFRAKKTGSNDGGIDIIATSITRPIKYSFNIQCKFFNKPLSKAPTPPFWLATTIIFPLSMIENLLYFRGIFVISSVCSNMRHWP